MHYHARDMAIVRAHLGKIPVILSSATPSVETEVNARRGRYRRLPLPERFGGQHLPHIEAIDHAHRRPRARTLHRAAARRGGEDRARTKRAGAAVSQSSRLRAADAVPLLRLSHRLPAIAMPGWSITGSSAGSSATIAASRCRCRRSARNARRRIRSPPIGPGVERLQEEAANLFPDARTIVLSSDLMESVERLREELDGVAEGKFDIIIGTQLVAKGHHFPKLNLVGIVDADLGLVERRSARGRAHLPAAASGGGPRRPRSRPGPGLSADASAGASGDARADFRRPRGLLRCRDRLAREDRLSALRAARGAGRVRRRQARDRKLCAQARGGRHRSTTSCACWARPKRRSRWCAGAIAFAC